MKRDFLKNLDLGDGVKLPDSAVEAIMAEYGKSKKQFETQISTLNTQLTEANGKLEGYDPSWKQKAENAQKELERQQFDFALERAVSAAKPRNAKAVTALLDREKLTFAGGEIVGLDKQLTALKAGEDTAFLFESDTPRKTGLSHQGGRDVGGDDKKEEANNALRSVFGSRE